MIKIDELDIKVLSFMYDRRNKPSTIRPISRKVISKDKPSKEDLDKMDKLIGYRFIKYLKHGLLNEGIDESDGRKIYRLSRTVWKKKIKDPSKKIKGYWVYLMLQCGNQIIAEAVSKPVNASALSWKNGVMK